MIIWIFPKYRYLNIRYYEYCLNIDIWTYDINISQHMIARNIWLAEKRMNIGRDMVSPLCQINLSAVARQSLHCLFSEEGKHYTVIIGFSQRFTGGKISQWFTGGKISVNFTPHMCFASFFTVCAWNTFTPHSIFIQYSICCISNSTHPSDKE